MAVKNCTAFLVLDPANVGHTLVSPTVDKMSILKFTFYLVFPFTIIIPKYRIMQQSFKKVPSISLTQALVSTPLWSPITPVGTPKTDSPQPQSGPGTLKIDDSGMLLDVGSIQDWFDYNSELASLSSDQAKLDKQQTPSSTVHMSDVVKCADFRSRSDSQESTASSSQSSFALDTLPAAKCEKSLAQNRPAEPPNMPTQALESNRRMLGFECDRMGPGLENGQRKSHPTGDA